jgi:anti-sigma B factor antagonist
VNKTMALVTKNLDDVVVVEVPGPSLDASNSKDFKNEVAPILESSRKVIFNLEHLGFVDSSGLGSVLSCLRQLNSVGGDLKLCGMTKPVRTLFELVRMHRIFDIHNTCEEAVAAFK